MRPHPLTGAFCNCYRTTNPAQKAPAPVQAGRDGVCVAQETPQKAPILAGAFVDSSLSSTIHSSGSALGTSSASPTLLLILMAMTPYG